MKGIKIYFHIKITWRNLEHKIQTETQVVSAKSVTLFDRADDNFKGRPPPPPSKGRLFETFCYFPGKTCLYPCLSF